MAAGSGGDKAIVDQLRRIRVRQRLEQHRVHEAEHHGVHAEAERQRRHREQRKPWGSDQSSDGQPEVAQYHFDHSHGERAPFFAWLRSTIDDPGNSAQFASVGHSRVQSARDLRWLATA